MHAVNTVPFRLDRLEEKGRHYLARRAHRDSLAAALRWAALTAPAVPMLLVVAALAGYRPSPALAVAAVLVPAAVAVLVFAMDRRRLSVERSAALGVLDRRLATQDRIAAVAEFAVLPQRDGFRDAAIQEAMPWLDRALVATIDDHARPPVARRTFYWLAAAGVLLVLAFLIRMTGADIGAAHPDRAVRSTVRGAVDDSPMVVRHARDVAAGSRPAVGGDVPAGNRIASSAPIPSSASPSNGAARSSGEVQGGDGARPSPAREGASAAPSTGRGATPGRGSAQAGAGAGGQQGGQSARTPQRDGVSTPPLAVPPGSGAPPPTRADVAPAAQGSPPPPPGGSAAGSPKGPQNAPSAARQSGGQPQQASRSRGQQGGQSTQGRSSNRGQSGGTTGIDAIKRSRGSIALMLAVPLEDRITGTVNAGRSTSTLRPSRPRAVPATPAEAQARGVQGGDAGRLAHATVSTHDDLIVRDYFMRRNGQVR